MQQTISQTAFGKLVGVSQTTVNKMVSAGKLPVAEGGRSIVMPDGLAAFYGREDGRARKPADPNDPREALARAQVREREAKAEAREIDLRRARGELVEVATVQADAVACVEVIRQQLLALPGRVALQLEQIASGPAGAPRAAQIEALVADEVNIALTALHSSRFART